jgi:hypothetical protein
VTDKYRGCKECRKSEKKKEGAIFKMKR